MTYLMSFFINILHNIEIIFCKVILIISVQTATQMNSSSKCAAGLGVDIESEMTK